MAKKANKKPSFEELLSETEAAVERLEAGELPLEESLTLYEKGVGNLKECSRLINEAQQKVQKLIEAKDGELGLVDFEAEEDGADDSKAEED